MAGIAPSVPVTTNRSDIGYALVKTLAETTKQNFKNLLFTNPGEKIYDARFGVALKKFLFEPFTSSTESKIVDSINEQVNIYMPYLKIKKIDFLRDEDNSSLNLKIYYFIEGVQASDLLEIDIGI